MLVIKQFGPVTYAMGTLQEILAGTGIAAKVRALPNDVAGCTLEMSASGWVGCLGVFASDAAMAAATGGNYANLSINGVTAITATITAVWNGAWWDGSKTYGVAMVGDSLSATSGNGGWYDQAIIRSNGSIISRGNFARSGATLYDMRTQMLSAVSSGANEIFIHGGTNRHAVDGGTDYIAGAIADMKWLIEFAKSHGKMVTIFGIPPASAPTVDGYISYCNQCNYNFAMLAKKYSVRYLYLWQHVVDPSTGAPSATCVLSDYVHYNQTAQKLAADKLLSTFPTSSAYGEYLPSIDTQYTGDIWGNPLNIRVSTAGELATDWIRSSLVSGFATSVATASSGFGNTQSIVATALTSEKSLFRIASSVVAGTRYLLRMKLDVQCSSDSYVRVGMQWLDAAYGSIRNDYAIYGIPAGGLSGVVALDMIAPSGIDPTKCRAVAIVSGSTASPQTVTVSIERMQMSVVN